MRVIRPSTYTTNAGDISFLTRLYKAAKVYLKQETFRQAAADLYFLIPYQGKYQNDGRVFKTRVRYLEVGITVRIETPSISAGLYRSGIKMTICGKQIDEEDNILVLWTNG